MHHLNYLLCFHTTQLLNTHVLMKLKVSSITQKAHLLWDALCLPPVQVKSQDID